MRGAVGSHNLIYYVFLLVYGMILQWIRVMQHRFGGVAPEKVQHVSFMH